MDRMFVASALVVGDAPPYTWSDDLNGRGGLQRSLENLVRLTLELLLRFQRSRLT